MKMKRILALFLSLILAVSVFGGCGGQSESAGTTQATEAPGPTQSPEEQAVLRVISIGNSHTNDTRLFWASTVHVDRSELN